MLAWVKISLFLELILHIDDKKKDTLILGIGPTQKLDDTTLKAEAKYSINFSKSNKKFV